MKVVSQGGTRFELQFASREEFAQEFEANLKNLGIFLPSGQPLPLHTIIQLDVTVPGLDRPLALAGTVVHVATAEQPLPGLPPGLAVQLQALPAECCALAQEDARVESLAPRKSTPGDAATDEKEDQGGAGISIGDGANIFQAVRSASLTEKIKLAKQGTRQVLNVLIQEGDKQIMKFVIQNPRLGSAEVLLILKNPTTSLELIQAIAKNSGWTANDEVRYQLVICPRTPLPLCLQLLNSLNPKDLSKIAKSNNVKNQLKSHALKLLMQRH